MAFCTPTKAMDKLLVLGSVSLSGTLLAGVTALICRGLKGKISARAVYVLWILVLLRFLCPWTTSHSLLNQAVEAPQESWTLTVPEQTGSPAAEPVSPRTSPVTTEALLWAVWLTGAGVILAVRCVSYARFSRSILRRARPAPKETQAAYAALTGPYRRPPKLVCSPDAVTPMLMGLLRPVVVLPCLSLEREALEALLSHELTHWRRRDLLVKRIAVAVSVLHWFNPAAWWLLGQLDRVCELACDETVCRGWDQARRARYGQLLLELCAVPAPHFAACLSKKQCLKERLIHIMDHKRKPFAGVLAAGACVAVLITSVALGAYAAPTEEKSAGSSVQLEQQEVTLQWPMETQGSVTLSVPFGSRVHPITGQTTSHSGIDIVLDAGTPVLASAAGTVAETDYNADDGRYIVLDHGGLTTKYCRLSEIQVTAGETVNAGEAIGAVGKTGKSTGPHLHFEVAQNDSLVDPLSLLPQTTMESQR